MAVLHLRGVVLPDGEERDLYVHGDRVTFDPVPNAETVVDGGWLVPGLVDAHNHPGAERPGADFDPDLLRRQGEEQVGWGELTIRSPGAAERLPSWYGADDGLPRVQQAGPWVAVEGRFFRGWGRQVPVSDVAAAAEEEARASGSWAKVVSDWAFGRGEEREYVPSVSPEVLTDAVRRVHAVGGRVAVHSQHRDTAVACVEAGVDTLEHGLHLPFDLLDRMAEQGTALVPTLAIMNTIPEQLSGGRRSAQMTELLRTGYERAPRLAVAAYEAGVTLLAGTDFVPQHHVAEEVRALVAAGVPAEAALGAASWVARRYLGHSVIEEGGLADVVAYDADPRADLSVLTRPARIILRGRVVR